jgi:hypothetical protein
MQVLLLILATFCAGKSEQAGQPPKKQRMMFLAIASEGKATAVTGGKFITNILSSRHNPESRHVFPRHSGLDPESRHVFPVIPDLIRNLDLRKADPESSSG